MQDNQIDPPAYLFGDAMAGDSTTNPARAPRLRRARRTGTRESASPATTADEQQLALFSPELPDPKAEEQRLNLLALRRAQGLGEASLKALLKAFPNLKAVWDAAPAVLHATLADVHVPRVDAVIEQITGRRQALEEQARRDREWLAQRGIALLTPLDEEYPGHLATLADRPEWLFVRGDMSVLSMVNLVTVVGTRDATPQGMRRTRRLTMWLAEKGFGIVSGLAEGIDEAAHEAALDYGTPTIAVLGNGIDVVFPMGTRHIRERIIEEGGTLVTEYFPGERYDREKFVRRNRIQAGLSYATTPIEARINSGTAHTYRFARKYNKVIFGVTARSDTTINGILELLRRDGYQVFDIDSSRSLQELGHLLDPVTPGQPVRQRPGHIFRGVLREFERVMERRRIDDDDFDALLTRLHSLRERQRDDNQSSYS